MNFKQSQLQSQLISQQPLQQQQQQQQFQQVGIFLNDDMSSNQQSLNDFQRKQLEAKRDQFTCEDVHNELVSLKELSYLISSAIASEKIEDIDDVIKKIQINIEPQHALPLNSSTLQLQNAQAPSSSQQVPSQTVPQDKQKSIVPSKSQYGLKQPPQQQKGMRPSNYKDTSFSQNSQNLGEPKSELSQLQKMDDFLDKMRNEIDKSRNQTEDLKKMIEEQNRRSFHPNKRQGNNKQEKGPNIGQEEGELVDFEFQKKLDKNRDDIVQAQKKIHNMQNQRLVAKITELHKELQQKIFAIEEKDKDYMHFSKKVWNNFGILELQFDYEEEQEKRKKIQNELPSSANDSSFQMMPKNNHEISQYPSRQEKKEPVYRKGYFIFDVKELIIAESLLMKDEGLKEYRFPYDTLTEVKYKDNDERIITVTWNFKDSDEDLKIKFSKDDEMNKFDMLLYILSLNNSLFKSNQFSQYFDRTKHPDLPNPYPRDNRKLPSRLNDIYSQRGKSSSINLNQGSLSPFRGQQQYYNFGQEQKQIVNNVEKNQIFRVLGNNSDNKGQAEFVSQNAQNSNLEASQIFNQQKGKKNRSFTPVNESNISIPDSQSNTLPLIYQYYFFFEVNRTGNFKTNDPQRYEEMKRIGFWEQQVNDCVNQNFSSVKVYLRDKFRQVYAIRIETKGKNAPIVFEEDFSKLKILRMGNENGDGRSFKIQIESKESKEGKSAEIITFDAKRNSDFLENLRIFALANTTKTKEIQKAITDLEYGMIFLKYSKQAIRPHEKLFFYRHDDKTQKHLLISRLPNDTNVRNDKIAQIEDIANITKQVNDGPGLKKFEKSDQRIINELCVVITLSSGKTIEILAKTQTQRDQFFNYISILKEQVNLIKRG